MLFFFKHLTPSYYSVVINLECKHAFHSRLGLKKESMEDTFSIEHSKKKSHRQNLNYICVT